jgi:micrococcal nuclease
MEYLNTITLKDTVEFTFPITHGKVVKVYDADTITIAFKLPYDSSPIYRENVRLFGIDAPEIKGKSEEEKLMAKEARDYLSSIILGKIIRLEIIHDNKEKYGRILAKIYHTVNGVETCLNDLLIEQRYVIRYDGGTKVKPESWFSFRQNK